MTNVHVIAIFTTKVGMRAPVLAALSAIESTVIAEAGCIEYCLTVDVIDASPNQASLGPDTFMVVENWESLAALKAHAVSPHMADFSKNTAAMISNKTVHILESV